MEYPFLPVGRWDSPLLIQKAFYGSQVRWGIGPNKMFYIHQADLKDARMLISAFANPAKIQTIMLYEFVSEAEMYARDLDWSDPVKTMETYMVELFGGDPTQLMHRGREVRVAPERPQFKLLKGGKDAPKSP